MVSIEANTILVEEVLIVKVVFRFGDTSRRCRRQYPCRVEWNPLVSQRLSRLIKPGLNNDDFPARRRAASS